MNKQPFSIFKDNIKRARQVRFVLDDWRRPTTEKCLDYNDGVLTITTDQMSISHPRNDIVHKTAISRASRVVNCYSLCRGHTHKKTTRNLLEQWITRVAINKWFRRTNIDTAVCHCDIPLSVCVLWLARAVSCSWTEQQTQKKNSSAPTVAREPQLMRRNDNHTNTTVHVVARHRHRVSLQNWGWPEICTVNCHGRLYSYVGCWSVYITNSITSPSQDMIFEYSMIIIFQRYDTIQRFSLGTKIYQ